MFNIFGKRNQKVKEKVVEKVYDNKVYRGIWQVGDKTIIGAYYRNGSNCISTEKGVYNVPTGTQKRQIANAISIDNQWFVKTNEGLKALNVKVGVIEHGIECLQNNHCALFVTEDEL